MNIQKLTKRCLKDFGWTQEQLAREVGIHPITLNRLIKSPTRPVSAYDKLFSFLSERYPEQAESATPSTTQQPDHSS